MGITRNLWRSSSLLIFYALFNQIVDVAESVVASEWSLAGPADEYVMAVINVTYTNPLTGHQKHPDFGGEIGKFGMGKVASASGIVMHVRSRRSSDGKINHYGCETLDGPFPDRPWIALIKRGNCNFDRKLENAQARNALAMVVYDLEDRETLEKMGLSNCRNCSIPGIFTYKRIGEEIANASDNGTLVEMHISIGETCTRPYSGINRTSVLFVSISFIVLMIISLAWLVFYYVQRFRYLHAKDRLAQRLCNAAKKALAKIPTRNVKLTDKEITGEAECCAVCIEYYASGDVLRTLPCRHEFHKGCVDPWLLEHRTCPMCKMDILKYYGFIFTGSQESILHLEDGNLNSSDSRDSDTPNPSHQSHPVRYSLEPSDTRSPTSESSHPQSSNASSCPHQGVDGSVRKPSLISLTVVTSPRGQMINQTAECIGGGPLVFSPSSGSGKSFGFDCKCRCSCDKSTVKTSGTSPLPDFQHPMCYVHEEGEIDYGETDSHDNSLGDNISERGIPSSHQPLIHREDSGLVQQNRGHSQSNLNSRATQFVDTNGKGPSEHAEESRYQPNQDFNSAVANSAPSASGVSSPRREETEINPSSNV